MGQLTHRVSVWTAALLSASAAAEGSISLVKRDHPAVVSAKLHLNAAAARPIPVLQARDGTISAPAVKDSGGYNLNVSIGTPPQPVALLVDARASGIAVLYPGADSVECSEERYCSFYGQFDPRNSSSFTSEKENWREQRPEYFTGLDTLTLGDSKVTNVSLGLATVDGISSYSSIGIGPGNTSFVYQLVDQGLISTPSFSMWRDPVAEVDVEADPGDTPGGIIFGGINAAKFNGPLHAFSFNDTVPTMTVPVRGVQVHVDPAASFVSTANSSTSTGAPITATFDETPFDLQTRYVISYFPRDTTMAIYTALNMTTTRRDDGYYPPPEIPCSRSSENHTITFLIGSASFDIPWTAFLSSTNIPSNGQCYFHIHIPTDDAEYPSPYQGTLGSMILSHLYMAVDYNSMMVGLAPVNQNPGDDDEILEIGTAAPQLPDAEGDFPETVSAYTPALTTETVATETSDGFAASMRTAAPGVLPAVAGVVLFGMI
ncbi:aspartic peptidase domain-containing protein [Aspergillus pseudoustus]|uniref:Aspartic peptidase domain-containing protein n=1 Tax=Aspergillus pseudoustus TaxID=1810923 RepID=A0ABR4L230_9EURO